MLEADSVTVQWTILPLVSQVTGFQSKLHPTFPPHSTVKVSSEHCPYAIHSTVIVGISLTILHIGSQFTNFQRMLHPTFPLHRTVEASPEHCPYAIHSTVIVGIGPCILHIGSVEIPRVERVKFVSLNTFYMLEIVHIPYVYLERLDAILCILVIYLNL